MAWLLFADGTPEWLSAILATAVVLLPPILAYMQQRNSRRMKKIEDRQERDGNVLTAGFVRANYKGTIEDVDPIVCALSGWRREDLIGQPVTVLTPVRERAKHDKAFAEAVRSPYQVRR